MSAVRQQMRPTPRVTSAISPADVIRVAVAAFNAGDGQALTPSGGTPGRARRRPQELLGCSAGRRCLASRPIPVPPGDGALEIISLTELDERRVICSMVAAEDLRLVGFYAVDDGRLTAACHYFSDVDMLVRLGIVARRDLDSALPPWGD